MDINVKFILPNSYIIPRYKRFKYTMHATSGEHYIDENFYIYGGYNSSTYIMAVPKVYGDQEWIFWYSVGSVANVIEPSSPVIPKPPGKSGSSPRPGRGGGYTNQIIPENLLQGYNIYIDQGGRLSFYESDAQKFTFSEGGIYDINIYALSIDAPAPRIIGGFFTSATEIPEKGVEVSVILQNIHTGEELVQSFTYMGDAIKYKFVTYGEGESRARRNIAERIPKPEVIVSISTHWHTKGY